MNDEHLTFEKLPEAVGLIVRELAEVKRLVCDFQRPEEVDVWFSIDELCAYLPDRPAKQTVYDWVHRRIIPVHKGQKKLSFLKSEIDEWRRSFKRKSCVDIEREAEVYLSGGGDVGKVGKGGVGYGG